MILPALQYHPYRTLANLRRKFVRRLAHQPVLSGVQVSGNPGAHQPADIIALYVRRWQIEVTFAETRAHLGVETQRQWTTKP
jgi:IS4 transposase